MPRKLRILVDHGIYHVYSRGNNRQTLFQTPKDYQIFLKLISESQKKYAFSLFHYCLMSNHFHFLVRVVHGEDLPLFMHKILLGYTRYYKKEYDFKGHVFESRYKSPHISEESYYLQCGRYIERNPVKAEIVKRAWDYPYSSARHYVLGEKDVLITDNLYYQQMGQEVETRKKIYRNFVSFEEPYGAVIDKDLNH